MTKPTSLLAALALAGVAFASSAGAASAATVSIDPERHRLVYTANKGEANRPHVDVSMFGGQTAKIIEKGNKKLVAGPGCQQEGPKRATCGDPASIGSVSIDTGNFSDRVRLVGNPLLMKAFVDAGSGDDSVRTADIGGESFITGGSGADTLTNVGDGQSTIGGGTGNDAIKGGDKVDALYGSFGTDVIDGGTGDDILYGLTEGDILAGGFGDDTLLGGDGGDVLTGGPGADSLEGESGNDQLNAQDGVADPVIDCGPGADDALFDWILESQNVSSC